MIGGCSPALAGGARVGVRAKACAGSFIQPPGFERLNNNYKKRNGPNLSFRYILQKSKYKKPTFEGRFFVITRLKS